MSAVVAVLVGVVVVAVAASELPVFGSRHVRWWRLISKTPEVDPRQLRLAMSSVRSRWRATWVTVVRHGTDGAVSSLWLGVRGVRNPEPAAAALAAVSGATLGAPGAPPAVPANRRWWMSVPVGADVLDDEAVQQRSATAESAGIHREAYESEAPDVFSEYVDEHLGAGDVLIISATPHHDNKHIKASVLTTQRNVAYSWTDACNTRTRVVLPAWRSRVAAVGGLLLVLSGLASVGVLGVPVGSLSVGWLVAVFAVGVAGVLSAGWHTLRPRAVERARLRYVWPLRRRQVRRLGLLPVEQFGGWANSGGRSATTATDRVAPDPVTVADGTLLGADSLGRDCFLPDVDRQWGVVALGDPGMGKSTFLRAVLYADAAQRVAGREIAGVWLETKGEGARDAAATVRAAGLQPLVLQAAADAADAPRLELLDWSAPDRSARMLTEAVKYAFPGDAIRDESTSTLNTVFELVLGTADNVALQRALGYAGRPNVVRVAFRLMGGEKDSGDTNRSIDAYRTYGGDAAVKYLSTLPPHTTKTQSEMLYKAPRNKLEALLPAESLFEAGVRPFVTFDRILECFQFAVVDLSPVQVGGVYTERTSKIVAAMSMYVAWDTVKRRCDRWQQLGRSVVLYSDELADLAQLGDTLGDVEIVQQLADQGRSRGVWPTFATQRVGQLPRRTQDAVMSFGSRVYFRQNNIEVAQMAAADLSEVYSHDEIRSFPRGMCAASLRNQSVLQPAFALYPKYVELL